MWTRIPMMTSSMKYALLYLYIMLAYYNIYPFHVNKQTIKPVCFFCCSESVSFCLCNGRERECRVWSWPWWAVYWSWWLQWSHPKCWSWHLPVDQIHEEQTYSKLVLVFLVLWIHMYLYFLFCLLGADRCRWKARVEGLSGHPWREASAGLLFWSLIGHWRFIRCGSLRSSHLFSRP